MARKDRNKPESGPGRNWMTPPLTPSEPPVDGGSVLAAVLALGDSTDNLTQAVRETNRDRKMLTAVVGLFAILVFLQCAYTAYFENELRHLSAQNHTLLANVESVTNPEAQTRNNGLIDAKIDHNILCIEDFIANGKVTDPTCPTRTASK